MPKRPCSLALTRDNLTILSADKFGDVYALPLLPSPIPPTTTSATPAAATPSAPSPPASVPDRSRSASATPSTATPNPFKPQANELTVHTKRNLRALENQKISLGRRALQEQLNRPQFELTLLLGHVSMLTAIAVATATVPDDRAAAAAGGERVREYILTADRDEHIRVSRGMPQAHVIERFCLGHEDFVSRLCVAPGGRADVLISGGGDDDLFVWDWAEGRLLGRAGVLEHVKRVVGGGEEEGEVSKVAVTRVFACAWEGGVGVFVVVERYVISPVVAYVVDCRWLHITNIPPASPRSSATNSSRTTPSSTAKPSPHQAIYLILKYSRHQGRRHVFWPSFIPAGLPREAGTLRLSCWTRVRRAGGRQMLRTFPRAETSTSGRRSCRSCCILLKLYASSRILIEAIGR